MSKLILHLDDEPAIREILATALGAHGYRVASATTPTEAINAAKQERPDLMISDLQLEEGDGLETVRQIRQLLPGLPVIILTGVLVDTRVAEKSVAKDADVYLPKTGSLAKIIEEVKRLIGS